MLQTKVKTGVSFSVGLVVLNIYQNLFWLDLHLSGLKYPSTIKYLCLISVTYLFKVAFTSDNDAGGYNHQRRKIITN